MGSVIRSFGLHLSQAMVGQKLNARAKQDGFHDVLNLSPFSISIFSNEIPQSSAQFEKC
jgi:hypothetical protein